MANYEFAAPATKHSTFKPIGYGPFTVKRALLVDRIIAEASPDVSVHMSGCRGAGKTIFLHEIGKKLVSQGKRVYFFKSSQVFERVEVQSLVEKLIKSGDEAYVLVDETQANHESGSRAWKLTK
jgi:predicted AAA+ superfamily ATPase